MLERKLEFFSEIGDLVPERPIILECGDFAKRIYDALDDNDLREGNPFVLGSHITSRNAEEDPVKGFSRDDFFHAMKYTNAKGRRRLSSFPRVMKDLYELSCYISMMIAADKILPDRDKRFRMAEKHYALMVKQLKGHGLLKFEDDMWKLAHLVEGVMKRGDSNDGLVVDEQSLIFVRNIEESIRMGLTGFDFPVESTGYGQEEV